MFMKTIINTCLHVQYRTFIYYRTENVTAIICPYMAKVFPFDIVLKIVRKPASYSGPLSDNKCIQQPTLTVSINIKLYLLRGSFRYLELIKENLLKIISYLSECLPQTMLFFFHNQI